MRCYDNFHYRGAEQLWTAPAGIIGNVVTLEAWGAAGGMPSQLRWPGRVGQNVGGVGPANIYFTNSPSRQTQLGVSYSNNAGYAKGNLTVVAGHKLYVNVGGNGQPGYSAIRLNANGTYSVSVRGGKGGWNGGGTGGRGAAVTQNLFNSMSNIVTYKRPSIPPKASLNQTWWNTTTNIVYKCNHAYTSAPLQSYWTKVTATHVRVVGPSGGGGGGATDFRLNNDDTTSRILVAGGSGGAGGHWDKIGTAGWALQSVPNAPTPPFGTDTLATPAAQTTGLNKTWATNINYLTGGWGRGGIGGSPSCTPSIQPTSDGGQATTGDAGTPGTNRHQEGVAPTAAPGSGGLPGTNQVGGSRGSGGINGSGGNQVTGGNGADADGGVDEWCAGGAGGGGGYWGGGGGGQGFMVSGQNSSIGTRSGGGGSGSNYASPLLTAVVLAGGARPPAAVGTSGQGANGLGGFARVSYNLPPKATWSSIVSSVLGASNYTVGFNYIPARTGGAGIHHYVVGTNNTTTASTPSTQTTVMVPTSQATKTAFTYQFTAPAIGSSQAIYVQVVDTDGDASPWLKQIVTGVAAAPTTAVTITAPSTGAQVVAGTPLTVTWTVGTQTPLCAYCVQIAGSDVYTTQPYASPVAWHRGGSRVNLALDPGFKTTAQWSSTSNNAPTSQTTNPGVSGSSGLITWKPATDQSAEVHHTMLNNLVVGMTYRLHLGVASNRANDSRPVTVQIFDGNGMINQFPFYLGATAANTYVTADIPFTPSTQGVYFAVVPSGSGTPGSALYATDFEDGLVDSWTGSVTNSATQSNSGSQSLKATGAGAFDPHTFLTGAGEYLASIWVYSPASATTAPSFTVTGTGVSSTATGTVAAASQVWTQVNVPFIWDGAGTVSLSINGDATQGTYWDDPAVYAVDNINYPAVGNADSGQLTYLKDMLVELQYAEDATLGYGTYFDGTNLNGNTGTQSWVGTTNASNSLLTGTDVLTSSITYTGNPLTSGLVEVTTLSANAVENAYAGAIATKSVIVAPSVPAAANVTATFDNTQGIVTLAVDAADGAATYKTTSFDIFRNGVRIATQLTPDPTTRLASFIDAPGNGVAATYVVRAWDSQGGYTDQPNGTVTQIV